MPRPRPRYPSAILVSLVLAALTTSVTSQSQRDRWIHLENVSVFPRIEWARASVPFEKGSVRGPIDLHVEGQPTAWRVLQRWPDQSVRLAQAQFPVALTGFERKRVRLLGGQQRPAPFQFHPAVSRALPRFTLATVVTDLDRVPYYALHQPLTSQPTVLEATEGVISVRSRTYHRNPNSRGIGRDFLSQTVYATYFSGLPYAIYDVVVANDYQGSDNPRPNVPNDHALADVGFLSLDLHVIGGHGLVRYAAWNDTGPHHQDIVGKPSMSVRLFGPNWLADAQGKRWRVIVFFDDPTFSGPVRDVWRLSVAAQTDQTLIPLADYETWLASAAFGLHGGPVAPPKDGADRILKEWSDWRSKDHFGAFGSWGDNKKTSTTGTPRNGPGNERAAHAIQTGVSLAALQLEGPTWQQTLRPYQIWGLRVDSTDDIYMWEGLPYRITSARRISRDTLGRYAIQQSDPWQRWRRGVPLSDSRGWGAYDPEHFSLDLLYDYWSLTGDHRTHDELVNLAECAMGLTRPFKYFGSDGPITARAEGWITQALVLAWFATGDNRYRDHVVHRIKNIIEPKRQKNHPSKAVKFENSHPLTGFPTPNKFYMPWQHASIIYSYMGVWRHFGEPSARVVAHDIVECIKHSWVFNHMDPKFGFVPNGLRFYTPVEYQGKPVPPSIWDQTPGIGVRWGDSPLGGAHSFFIAALDLLLEDAYDANEYATIRLIRRILHDPKPNDDAWRWVRWTYLREPPK